MVSLPAAALTSWASTIVKETLFGIEPTVTGTTIGASSA